MSFNGNLWGELTLSLACLHMVIPQKTYSHICTRVNSDLQALKKTIGERQAEMKILVVEEENQSNEMNTISNK